MSRMIKHETSQPINSKINGEMGRETNQVMSRAIWQGLRPGMRRPVSRGMWRKAGAWFTLLMAFSFFLVGCSGFGQPAQSRGGSESAGIAGAGLTNQAGGQVLKKVVDLTGREVEVKVPAKRIVAIGPGALRLVAYLNGTDRVVGIEGVEKQAATGKPYMLAHPELQNLPTIGQGGPDSAPDEEKLLSVKPDVIFVAYLADKVKADKLQAKTGIPVIVLSYGKLATFDEDIYRSLNLIGTIIGNEKRGQEVVQFLKDSQKDLAERTQGIPEGNKPKVYIGALGMKGAHGIESSQGKYAPFAAIGARNVVDETGRSGSVMIEKEKLLSWDPDILFLDEGGYSMVEADYKKNPNFYRSLRAVKNGQVYGQIPYNYYTTNIETALADTYYAGKVIFPDKFQDIDPVQKSDEIYRFFLGKPLYAQMAKDFGGFKKLDLTAP